MEKYRDGFVEKIKPRYNTNDDSFKVEPFRDAQFALRKATFASVERENFFNDAYVDMMADFFVQWLATEPHAVKEREFLYTSVLALGEVKNRLIQMETRGKNATYLNVKQSEESNEDEQ